MKTVEELLELIDVKYHEAKRLNLSRFDLWWGEWSALMNRSLRGRIKGNPNDLRLKYLFVYWSLRSQLLELHYKHKLFRRKEKRDIVDELKTIREMIMSGEGMEPLSENDLIMLCLKGVVKSESSIG